MMLPLCRMLPLFVAATLLLASSSTFTSFVRGDSYFAPLQSPTARGGYAGKSSAGSLVGEPTMSMTDPFEDSRVALAAQRTYRKDPLNGFKRYTGGWNLKERHYWASAGFTAAPLFAIAAIWFLLFGIFLLIFFISCCCCRHDEKEPSGHSQVIRSLSLVVLIITSIAAIIGCVILYMAQGRFHKSTSRALDFVVNQADVSVGKLKDMSDYIISAKQLEVDKVPLPTNVQTDIDQTVAKINTSASVVSGQTVESSDDIQHLLNSVRVALVIVSAAVVGVTFLGLLFSLFGMHLLIYILVVIGWILVAGTFISAGTFLILHNVSADTCVAIEEWIQIPTPHTTLDEILPCVDDSTIQETQQRSKEVTYQLVEVVNQVITNVSNLNFSPNFPEMYINQSGPLVPILCNPFHADFTDRPCSLNEVNLNNATEVWSNYVCQVSASGICATPGRLTPTFYDQMSAAVKACYGLYTYGPTLAELQDCTFVRQIFSDIHMYRCPGIQRYSKWVYIGFVITSAAVMVSVIMWIIQGKEQQDRIHAKQLEAGAGDGRGMEEHKHFHQS